MFLRLGRAHNLIPAIVLLRKDLQGVNMQEVDEIRAFRGEMHPLPVEALCDELLDEISSKTSLSC